jgi:4-hydroxy-tetrahydrodipicolinate synthase
MKTAFPRERLSGVWSAAPTPFTAGLEVDVPSVRRMVEHHVRLGIRGLFLLGTNGEGPWMTDAQRGVLVDAVAKANRGRMLLAVQVTDNSLGRILDNMRFAKAHGADIAVVAPPFFLMNATPANVQDLYLQAVRRSPLPVGIYCRGSYSSVPVPNEVLARVYREKNVVMVKDSSRDMAHRDMVVALKKSHPRLAALDGDEFDCANYLRAGYDGLLLGGGVFNGYMAGRILEAVRSGCQAEADRLQARMNRLMYDVYGGKKIACWLAGEKHLLVRLGILRTWRTLLNYPLTPACRRAIGRVLRQDCAWLTPWKGA